MNSQDPLRVLRELRKREMPTSEEVVRQTLERLGYPTGLGAAEARSNFNGILRQVFEHTLIVLEEHEKRVDADRLLPALVDMHEKAVRAERLRMRQEGDDAAAFREAVVRLLRGWHELLRGLFLSVSQSRKQRGGKDFEHQIRFLLQIARVPHEMQPRRERADFILPSSAMLYSERTIAVVLSVKRTLRERWQQVVRELQDMSCPNTFLATADDAIPEGKVRDIKNHNIYLVTWDEVKEAHYTSEPMVLGYSAFMSRLETRFLPLWQSAQT